MEPAQPAASHPAQHLQPAAELAAVPSTEPTAMETDDEKKKRQQAENEAFMAALRPLQPQSTKDIDNSGLLLHNSGN